MRELAHKVLEPIRRHELLKAGDRVGVAVSGGADSVGLLRLLLELRRELGLVLSVVHFNHKLRARDSDADERFVADLARQHKLELHLKCADVKAHAAGKRLSIETAARELRYEFFMELLGAATSGASEGGLNRVGTTAGHYARPDHYICLDKVATGHTLDDQAETVLMRVLRGTGTGGLGGIYPRLVVEGGDEDSRRDQPGEIIRPLLGIRRRELEQYLTALGQPWRDDATNTDLKFTRNRVRHRLLPLLEREFNPGIVAGLSDLAEIARAEEDYWQSEASGWMGTTVQWFSAEAEAPKRAGDLVQLTPAAALHSAAETDSSPAHVPQRLNASVDLVWLLAEPVALQRRVIKSIGEEAGFSLEFKHIEEILRFAAVESNTGKHLALPLGWRVLREEDSLEFLGPAATLEGELPTDYEYRLAIPGTVRIQELACEIQAILKVPGDLSAGYNPEHLFDPALLSNELVVRNWRPGDRFWPAHTKSPKKIKELLQRRGISGLERKLWPVVASGNEIVWVRGFAGAGKHRIHDGKDGQEVVLIRELPIEA